MTKQEVQRYGKSKIAVAALLVVFMFSLFA